VGRPHPLNHQSDHQVKVLPIITASHQFHLFLLGIMIWMNYLPLSRMNDMFHSQVPNIFFNFLVCVTTVINDIEGKGFGVYHHFQQYFSYIVAFYY
jgi:hypothetical protein